MRALVSTAFVRLWIGNTASGLATWALPFVFGFALIDGQLTATDLGIALAARTTGFLLAVPIAGVLADRSGPRPVILTSGLVAAAAMLIILAAFAGPDALSSWLLLTGAFAVGIGQGACRPAYQAIIPELASDELLQPANAAMSISVRVTSIVGPAIFSLVAQSAGTMAALAAIALLWLTSALVPPRIAIADNKERHQRRLALTAIVFEFADGAREARRHPWFVAGLSALTVTIATGYSVTSVLLPGISQEVYRGAVLMTATATAYMAGALVGALLLTRWHPVERGWMAFAGLSIYGLAPISLLFPQDVIVPIAAYFVAGIGIEIFNVPWFTAIQNEIPKDRLSRVSSLDFLFSYGLAPVALASMMPLANMMGRDALLIATGSVCLVVPAAAALLVPTVRRFSRQHSRDSVAP
jgi:MFS family permease